MNDDISHSERRQFDDWYTIYDLMERFGQKKEWIHDHFVKAAPVPFRKVGSFYIWHKKRIDEWLLEGDDRPNGTA